MRTIAFDAMPVSLRCQQEKLGADIRLARRRRRLTMAMLAARAGTSLSTCQRVEKGDPTVAMGIYAMVLPGLDESHRISRLLDAASDDVGLMLERERKSGLYA